MYLLGTCRPSESAYEYAFEGNEKNGALTYWFLKSFEQIDKGLTYKVIHDRVVAQIHSQFPLQTPMLEGEGDREVFGINKLQTVYAASVMKIDRSNELLLLNAGQSHGIRKGTRFAIYPLAITDFGQVDKRLAIVEIDKRGATDSWAKIIADFRRGNIEQGAQAVLINPVDVRLKRKVYLVYENNEINDNKELSPSLTTTRNLTMTQQQALDKIRDTIMEKNKNNESLLELALADIDDQADFQIAINKQGEYEIWDPAGNAIPNLNPPLMINDSGSISKIIQRLEHLTKYSNIQLIDNLDAASELSRKLVVELFEVPDDYERGDRLSDLQPIALREIQR